MKNAILILFFSLVLLVYAAINYYIIREGLMVFEPGSAWRLIWIWLMVVLAVSFVAGRLLERQMITPLTTVLIWVGSFWLAIMVYLLLQLLLIDLIIFIQRWLKFLPEVFYNNALKTRQIMAIAIASITFVVVLAGHINTWFPKMNTLDLQVHKKAGKLDSLNIVAFSDVHLGTLIEKRHLTRIVKKVNASQADIILVPGDIIDEDIRPVIHSNVGKTLKKLKAKYGVYAVTGNHEYIGGIHKAKAYLNTHNIHLLNDAVAFIDNSFYIIGREDLMKNRMANRKREDLSMLVAETDNKFPLILLDHQPFHLEDAVKNGIDLQLSGHTHHGQLWPFNFITRMIYEKSWGYLRKGNTQFYVSGGVGGWGPPVRTVNRPEIVQIKLRFDKNKKS